jgi:hypothetical protein
MRKILKISSVFIPILLLLLSCDSKEREVEILQSEVIGIHDEVMPKMDDIMKLKKSLNDSIQKADSTQKVIIKNHLVSLEEADRAMMNWMRNYNSQMNEMTNDEKLQYLSSEKESITEVRSQMNSSISQAENYLKD